MRLIWIIISLVLFSVIGISESFAKECDAGRELIIKSSNGNPACVTPATAQKLVERGWGFIPEISLVPIQTNSENVILANNQFTIDFYSEIKDTKENIFFSPWSISTAFAIAYEGARGTTADEIQQVFGFPADDEQRRSEFKSINDDLNEKDAKYKLRVANALWLAEKFQPLQEYVDTAKNYYDSEVNNVDFISDEGANIINDWAKLKTENKIPMIIPPGSTDELTLLIITNAIYFNGTWTTQFDEKNTRDEDFKMDSVNVVTAPMMKLFDTKFNYSQNEQVQIIELPYEGDKLSMLILLPSDVNGLKSLEESLSLESLIQWKSELSETDLDLVQIPKFTLETKYDLSEKLINLGLHSAFDPSEADFSGIAEIKPLYIQSAVHKAFVDVNEVGTEAAAVTAIKMGTTSIGPPPLIFKADHPFIFLIQDKETNQILFFGRVVNPIE